jgi:atypical dual specificity phosphatase
VQAIVNLSAERPDNLPQLHAAQIDYLWLPVLDTRAPTVEQIHRGLAWIEQRVHARQTVYIHCAAGRGRSTTLLACWYISTHKMNVEQVVRFIKRRRPQTSFTPWQLRRLEEFAALLQNTAGQMASP